MIKKWTALFLTLAMLLSLSACSLNFLNRYDGKPEEPDAPPPEAVQPEEPDVPGEGGDDVMAEEPEIPDDAQDGPLPDPEEGEKEPELLEEAEITASHKDVTLRKGETFTLSAQNVSGNYACTFTSADETIATVDEKLGTVTAVAPGRTTVTMHLECESGQYDFECIIRCAWTEEDAPAAPEETPSAPEAPSASLSGFYDSLQSSYEGLRGMMILDGELLDSYYPGLSSIAAVEEVLIQETQMTMANVAVGLVKLSSEATLDDVTAVTDVLNARITAQAEGGAWYPASCETWAQGVITSVSNYVGMFVYPDDAQDMADLFTDTFSN